MWINIQVVRAGKSCESQRMTCQRQSRDDTAAEARTARGISVKVCLHRALPGVWVGDEGKSLLHWKTTHLAALSSSLAAWSQHDYWTVP